MAPPTFFEVVFTLLVLIGIPFVCVLIGFVLFGAIYQAQAPQKTAHKIELMREKNFKTQEQIRAFVDQTIQKMATTTEERMATTTEEQKRKHRVNHTDPLKMASTNEEL